MKQKLAAWSSSVALLALLSAASAQTLTHRYSFFNEANGSATATDTVASANGTLHGSAAITGGQLVLNAMGATARSLPNAGGLTGLLDKPNICGVSNAIDNNASFCPPRPPSGATCPPNPNAAPKSPASFTKSTYSVSLPATASSAFYRLVQ
jgi:hypothetical protein